MLTPEEEELLNQFDEETASTGADLDKEEKDKETDGQNNEGDLVDNSGQSQEEEEEASIAEQADENQNSEEEEKAESETSGEEEDTNAFEPIELKSKSVKLKVSSMDELVKLATQGLDYTKKTQMLSPFRQKIKTIEANGITDDDLALLKDLKSGDKTAFKKMYEIAGIEDEYGVFEKEPEYKSSGLEQVSDTQLEADDIIAEIQSDPEGSKELIEFTNNISDQNFVNTLGNDAKALQAVYNDVKEGIANEAVEMATRFHALNPQYTFGQAYVKSAMEIRARNSQQQKQTVETPAVKETVKKDVPLGKKLKSGMANGSRSHTPQGSLGIDDILNMPDQEFMSKLDDILK